MISNKPHLTIQAIAIKTIILSIRGYTICVVWDCYKYLIFTSRSVSLRHVDSRHEYVSPYDLIHELFSSGGTIRNGFFSRNGRRRDSGNDPDGNGFPSSGHRPDPKVTFDQVDELPKYEDALKIPANAYAPPPYFEDNREDGDVANNSNPDQVPQTSTSHAGLPNYEDINPGDKKL